MRQPSRPISRVPPEPSLNGTGPAGIAAAPARGPGNRATAALLLESIGPPGDALEQQAERVANQAASQRTAPATHDLFRSQPEEIRRAPKEENPADAETAMAEPAPETRQARTEAPPRIVDEDAEPGPGQMRKSEFMAALRSAICGTADAAMAGTGRTSQGCPWIDYWLGFYEGKNAAHLERAIRRFAPETAGAATARDYFAPITSRVRKSAETFTKTGEITGLPEDLGGGPSFGGGLLGAFGGMFFKSKPGRTRRVNPDSVRSQLGGGEAIPGGLRSRMESAFRSDFGHVRIHTDPGAAQLSDQLGARAFTVGEHVAFGPGEFRPGTPYGDALVAHELAHVVQQGDGRTAGASDHAALERNADSSAMGVVASTWSSAKSGLKNIGQSAVPRMRSGLQLQSCGPTYVTNRGATVETLSSGAPPMAPDITEAQADAQLTSLGLLSKVTKLRPPSNSYDCHGYTFLGGDRWINDDQVDAILADNGYAVTTTPSVGDIVVYRNGGAVTHSGIIVGVSGTTVTMVESKWGRLGLYRHAPSDVPPTYGSWQAYHTSRAGGHRLRSR